MDISAVWQEDQDGVPGLEGSRKYGRSWYIMAFDHSSVYGAVYKRTAPEEKAVSEETELAEERAEAGCWKLYAIRITAGIFWQSES